MARPKPPPGLDELRNPTSVENTAAALRQLKNFLIGHENRKQTAVQFGLIGYLTQVLVGSLRASGKRRSEQNGDASTARTDRDGVGRATGQDDVRLGVTILVGSLAHGGVPFLSPLMASGIIPPLLQGLRPHESSPQLVTATLKAVATIVDLQMPHVASSPSSTRSVLPLLLSTREVMDSLAQILAQSSPSRRALEQVSITTRILARASWTEEQCIALTKQHILDYLAFRLSATAASPGAFQAGPSCHTSSLPPPLPDSELEYVISAICNIINGSRYRIARFLFSPLLRRTFPIAGQADLIAHPRDWMPSPNRPTTPGSLLPQLQAVQSKSEMSKAFPSLTFNPDSVRLGYSDHDLTYQRDILDGEEFGSPVFTWLIHVARASSNSMLRLSAIRLITCLLPALDGHPTILDLPGSSRNRERMLALLVVPLLVREFTGPFNTSPDPAKGCPADPQQLVTMRRVKEWAPFLLSQLVAGSVILQKAAVDAGAIKTLCQILKKSFDSVPSSEKPMWSPHPPSTGPLDIAVDPASSTLGDPGLSSELEHAFICRASALEALAAIAEREDSYRKQIIEQNVSGYITSSLVPDPADSPESGADVHMSGSSPTDPLKANPVLVLKAACKATKSMSRSVYILRTSLIDDGIAKPVMALLKHPDPELQVSAMDVICNLLLNFSPMKDVSDPDYLFMYRFKMQGLWDHIQETVFGGRRQFFLPPRTKCAAWYWIECAIYAAANVGNNWADFVKDLMNGGIIKTLSEQVKSAHASKRLIAMWALKHAVMNVSNEVKKTSLDEIGRGWLVETLNGSSSEPHSVASITKTSPQPHTPLGTLNAAGQPVKLLNEDPSMEIDSDSDDSSFDGAPCFKEWPDVDSRTPPGLQRMLKALKQAEQDPAVVNRMDELRIQEQALDYIRNLLYEAGPDAADIIDHVCVTFKHDEFYAILTSKLRSKQLNGGDIGGFGSMAGTSIGPVGPGTTPTPSNRITYLEPPEIIHSTVLILVHLASGNPRQKAVLLAQKRLWQSLLPCFMHPDRRIRVACSHLNNNLTWFDENERSSAKQRALELRDLGVEKMVHRLLDDQDLDVRERAKTGVEQAEKLLSNVGVEPSRLRSF